jgi:hypothetical protein
MERRQLRPQDILVLSKLVGLKGELRKQIDLANQLGISQSEIVHSLKRLNSAGLYNKDLKSVNRLSVIEFIEHAIKFIFPIEHGGYSRGIRTGESSEFLDGKIMGNEFKFVWPNEDGEHKGISINPIYSTVAFAVKSDELLKKILNIVDVFRGSGSVRLKKIASTELRKVVLGS